MVFLTYPLQKLFSLHSSNTNLPAQGIEDLPHYSTLRLPEQPFNYVKQKLGKAAGGSEAALELCNAMLM
jgi:hypothetical protein